MTGTAVVTAVDVGNALTGGNYAVMTAGTTAQHLAMIHSRRRNRRPGGGKRLMARITQIAGINVTGAFSAGIGTVVATDTIIDKAGMVDGGW